MTESEKEYYSIAEVARRLNIHRNTLYRLISTGEIPAHRFLSRWRISRADLDAFLKRTRVEGTP